MATLYQTKLKENQLYGNTYELYEKIRKYFDDYEEGNPTTIDFPTLCAYITQLEKNLKKLMTTSYAGNEKVSEWIDDLNMFKIQKNKQEWYNGLQNVKNWMINCYNTHSSSKGFPTRLGQSGANKFINYVLRIDNIDTYKNIIKRIMMRQMTSASLYRTINSIIFQDNERIEESIEFEYDKKTSLNENFTNVFDSSLVDYSKDLEQQDLEYATRPIKQFLDENKIQNYTINDDMTVDVDGDVDLIHCAYKRISRLPIKFNKVNGDFICENSFFSCLDGFPRVINGSLYAAFSDIYDIEDYEIEIKKHCDFSNCPIHEFDPDNMKIKVGGNFWCGEEEDGLDIIK